MTRSQPLNDKLKVVPYDCVIVDNMRTMIKTRINEQSDKKAVVIGINPSVACEGKSDTTLTKISKYLYQYGIGEIAMINLFETISTEQDGIDYNQVCLLKKHEQLLKYADLIVVAWGTEDKYLDAKDNAFRYLLQWRDKVYCIDFVSRPMDRMMLEECCMSAPCEADGAYDIDIEPDDIDVTDNVTIVWNIG